MISDMVQKLVRLGFGQREAVIFLSLLEEGGLSASQIYKKTGIKRTTALAVCEQLLQKSLVYVVRGKGKTVYAAYPPAQIGLLLDAQRQEIDIRRSFAHCVIDELSAMYEHDARPTVWCEEGDRGTARAGNVLRELNGEIVRLTVRPELFAVSGDMLVCKDTICFQTHAPKRYTVVIRSQEIADMCRASIILAQKEMTRLYAS